MRAPGSRGSVHEVYDSKRPRSVDLGFCPIKTLGFRRRGLFGSRQSTLISQAIPRQTPGFLALSMKRPGKLTGASGMVAQTSFRRDSRMSRLNYPFFHLAGGS